MSNTEVGRRVLRDGLRKEVCAGNTKHPPVTLLRSFAANAP